MVRRRAALPAPSRSTKAIWRTAICRAATISMGAAQLSEEALAAFTRFFLETCLDQVNFMEGPRSSRIGCVHAFCCGPKRKSRLNALPPKAGQVLEAVLYRGELPRGEVTRTLGLTTRHARRIVATLLERGVLTSESSRAPLHLAFPAALASRWMPGLFPERANGS